MAALGYEFYLLVLKVSAHSHSHSHSQHEKIKFVSPSGHVMFCLFLYNKLSYACILIGSHL